MKSLIALSLMTLSFGAFANECLVQGITGGPLLAKLNTTNGITIVKSVYNSHVKIGLADTTFASRTIEIYQLKGQEHKLVKVLKQRTRALTPNLADKLNDESDNEILSAVQTACEGAQPITELKIEFPRINGLLVSRTGENTLDIPTKFCELNGFKHSTGSVKEINQKVFGPVMVVRENYNGMAEAGNIFKEISCAN